MNKKSFYLLALTSIGIYTTVHPSQSSKLQRVAEEEATALGLQLLDAGKEGDSQLAAVQSLIKSGANINIQDPNFSNTPLIWAAYNNDTAIFEALLQAGANPHIKNSKGRTVYDFAKHRPAIQKILRAKYNREVVEPEIVESIQEVDFPPELAEEVAEYAKIRMPKKK